MEKTQSRRPRGIWLAMSGGGLRAALFHYGALKRVYELNLLEDVTVISATSGGALIAALIGLQGPLTNGDAEKLPIPTKAPVCNGIMPPGDSGIMAPPFYEMIPPGRRVR
ncbi:MAG: hypothetical protein FJX45_19285 [Alphaproteobacteria bacterium]|nr:hypothetical protein [Alphaproteobacteria bacterium]